MCRRENGYRNIIDFRRKFEGKCVTRSGVHNFRLFFSFWFLFHRKHGFSILSYFPSYFMLSPFARGLLIVFYNRWRWRRHVVRRGRTNICLSEEKTLCLCYWQPAFLEIRVYKTKMTERKRRILFDNKPSKWVS